MLFNWSLIISNFIVSAVTAVIFTGGTNYWLQKKNRKANIVYEKGYELIDKINKINMKRVEVSTYITLFSNVPEDKLNQVYHEYVNEIKHFELEVKKCSVFLNKKLIVALKGYISYLKEVQDSFEKNFAGENFIINFNQSEIDLHDKIINLVKKHVS